jgi:hypothetical protein
MSDGAPSDDDFFAVEEAQDPTSLNRKIREVMDIEERLELIANEESELKERKTEILRRQLPALMIEMGTDLAQDPQTGYKIKLERAADDLPKDDEERIKAIEILEEIGIDEIIKTTVEIQTGPGSMEAEVFKMILGEDLSVVEEEYIKKKFGENKKLQDPDVIDAIETLKEKFNFDELKSKIKLAPHTMTYRSWAREQLSSKDAIEVEKAKNSFDRANIWHGYQAKISKAK